MTTVAMGKLAVVWVPFRVGSALLIGVACVIYTFLRLLGALCLGEGISCSICDMMYVCRKKCVLPQHTYDTCSVMHYATTTTTITHL